MKNSNNELCRSVRLWKVIDAVIKKGRKEREEKKK